MSSWLGALSIVEASALISGLALLVPIIIHLINPSKGQVIWVGNIEIIKKIKRSKANQLKIKRWLLLLLRVLIFCLISLILAGLINTKEFSTEKTKNVLLTSQWLRSVTSEKIKTTIAAHANNDIYVVTDRLIKINAKDFDSSKFKNAANTTYSQLLEAKLSLQSHRANLWVYTTDLNLNDSKARLIHIAKNVEIASHQADKEESRYQILILSEKQRDLDARIIENSLSKSLDKKSIKISKSDINEFDIKKYMGSRFNLIVVVSEQELLPAELLKPNGLLLSDARNNDFSTVSEFLALSSQIFKVKRSKEAGFQQASIIWRTQKQFPLLISIARQNYTQLHFYGRFHPEFNTLVESQTFPVLLGGLITRYTAVDNWRVSSAALSKESELSTQQLRMLNSTEVTLHSWLVLLLCLLWLVERFIAERIRHHKAHKKSESAALS